MGGAIPTPPNLGQGGKGEKSILACSLARASAVSVHQRPQLGVNPSVVLSTCSGMELPALSASASPRRARDLQG